MAHYTVELQQVRHSQTTGTSASDYQDFIDTIEEQEIWGRVARAGSGIVGALELSHAMELNAIREERKRLEDKVRRLEEKCERLRLVTRGWEVDSSGKACFFRPYKDERFAREAFEAHKGEPRRTFLDEKDNGGAPEGYALILKRHPSRDILECEMLDFEIYTEDDYEKESSSDEIEG